MTKINAYMKRIDDLMDRRLLIFDMNESSLDIPQNKTFDAICSDKILDKLSKEDIFKSLEKQNDRLNADGHIFHSFGRFKSNEDEIKKIFQSHFEILDLKLYTEKIEGDSFYIVAKKSSDGDKILSESLKTQKNLKGARIVEGNSNGRFEFNVIDRYQKSWDKKSFRKYFKN